MRILVAFLLLFSVVQADDLSTSPTYWLALTDTSGYTIQNADVDFELSDQTPSIKNVALNSIVWRGDSTLVRPALVQTILGSLTGARVDTVLSKAVVSQTLSLHEIAIRRLAEGLVKAGVFDSVMVKRTVVDSLGSNYTEDRASFKQ